MRSRLAQITLVVAMGLAVVAGKCTDCDQAFAIREAACLADPAGEPCAKAKAAYDKGCTVQPTPTPTPTPTPEPTPPPTPPTIPACKDTVCGTGKHCVEGVGCVADPTPPPVDPGEKPYTGTYVVNSKRYGNGVDSTLTVQGDCEYCASVGLGEYNGQIRCGCPLYPDGHNKRLPKELATMGGCPTWQFRTVQYPEWQACLQVDPYETGGMSCDHFGDPVNRDDPNTEPFEGAPVICALQRDRWGHPKAGFFIIAHGDGWVRACDAEGEHCGNATRVVY